MSELNPNLNQVLQGLEQLSLQEIAVIEEHLAARQNSTASFNGQSSDLFALSFADYLAFSDEERDAVMLRAYQLLETWINAELERRKAQWILVCGGRCWNFHLRCGITLLMKHSFRLGDNEVSCLLSLSRLR